MRNSREIYDSFLYGNGLTLSIFDKIKKMKIKDLDKKLVEDLLSFDKFLENIPLADTPGSLKFKEAHEKYKNEIKKLGLERWWAKNLLSKDPEIRIRATNYVYFFYNLWFDSVYKGILRNSEVRNVINKIGSLLLKSIRDRAKIYTLNFDTVLDECLNPQHLHGAFVIPFCDENGKIREGSSILFEEKNEFEYKYLLAPYGREKLDRLKIINNKNNIERNTYSLDFFFNLFEDLGHLLIYGIAFSPSNLQDRSPLNTCVDGHIVFRLEDLYKSRQIKQITIAWYSNSDLENYKDLFENTEVRNIIRYKHTSEIFDFLQ